MRSEARISLTALCRAAVLPAMLLLAGCSNIEDVTSFIFVAPGKFGNFACTDLAARGKVASAREHELKMLMEKADQSSGGALVNTLAYRGDYLTVQGELKQLEAEAAEKKCETPWLSISERSLR